MKYNNNALNILAMLSYTGIGNAFIVENYKKDMSDDEIVKLINSKIKNDKEKINIDDFFNKKDEIKNKLDKLEDSCTTFSDNDFPISINTKTSKQKKMRIYFLVIQTMKILLKINLMVIEVDYKLINLTIQYVCFTKAI